MIKPHAYSLATHGNIITDGPRMEAYTKALREAIRPGMKVLDLGAGPGILSLLACRFGAAHVFAIEPDDTIRLAERFAAENGFADRITTFQALSTAVRLPTKVDLIVSDLRGVLPLFEHNIPSIVDARRRLLADGGHMIPQVDTLWAALVGGRRIYQPFRQPWLENDLGLNLSAAQTLVSSAWRRVVLDLDDLLCPAQHWATLDYRTVERPNLDGEVSWTLERTGTVYGLAVWFDTRLDDTNGFSNAPGEPEMVYGQAFFPWPKPQELSVGDRVSVNLRANLTGDDYTWRWRSRICAGEDPDHAKEVFDQSTFFANLVSTEELRRHEADSSPTLDENGRIDNFILSQMDGRTTLGEIARRTAENLPEHFSDWKEALTRAGDLAAKYGKS